MKKAIITGSTGLVGSRVTRKLMSCGVEVLCLGRQKLTDEEVISFFGKKTIYIPLEMNQISDLEKRTEFAEWTAGNDCVFFHFAWSGKDSLTDGNFSLQMDNAVWAANAVKIAKRLKCTKFVNAGSLEETFVERCLSLDSPHTSGQTNYALAKLAARDLCKITAYLEKIDYTHTRMSVPFCGQSSNGYIAQTLRLIKAGNSYDRPANENFFDIISIDDVATAYYLIGKKGKNNSNYFIGTERPVTLTKFFELSEMFYKNRMPDNEEQQVKPDILFDTNPLRRDCGFIASEDPITLIKKL